MSQFPCTACGQCCKNVRSNIKSAELGTAEEPFKSLYLQFPYTWKEDGSCEKLDPETNQCTVYNNRPFLCHVDKVYYTFFATQKPVPLCDPGSLPKMDKNVNLRNKSALRLAHADWVNRLEQYIKDNNIKYWQKSKAVKPITKKEFFKHVATACNKMIIDNGLDTKYIIKEAFMLPLVKQK